MHLKKLTFVNKYLKFIIGGVISAAGIYLAFKGEDFGELKTQIKSVNLTGFIAANILIVLSCFIRAYRWKLIIDPVENISLMPWIAGLALVILGMEYSHLGSVNYYGHIQLHPGKSCPPLKLLEP